MADTQKPTKRAKPERGSAGPVSALAAEKAAEKAKKAERAAKAKSDKAAEKAALRADKAAEKAAEAKADKESAKPSSGSVAHKRTSATKPKEKQKFEFTPAGIIAWASEHKVFVGVLAAVVFLIFVLYPPVCSYYAAVRTNTVLQSKLSDVKDQVEDLSGDVNKLTSEEGLKDEARRLGYVEDGETAVTMEGIEDSGSARSDTSVMEESQEEETEDPWYIQMGDVIFGYNPNNEGIS